jgi:diaminopimelate epimerase
VRVLVTKMHGTRNDFVVLDQRTARLDDLPSFARWVCERRGGIGADGLIALDASAVADLRMRTINADGSEAEMCGNGVRCAARWADEAGLGDRIAFETEAGVIQTEIVAREPEYCVRVAMGRPRIGVMAALDEASFVELGNPHVVFLRDRLDEIDLPALGQRLQRDSRFPAGVNVHVAALAGSALRVRHWERGVGLTMACGTGAVACAAVALSKKFLTSPVDVLVPGGRLVVEWDGRGGAYLTGPAARLFDAEAHVAFDASG